jgi:hypothetical protein
VLPHVLTLGPERGHSCPQQHSTTERIWEIARNMNTRIKGDAKVGAKVTVYNTMVATDIEVKEAKEKK